MGMLVFHIGGEHHGRGDSVMMITTMVLLTCVTGTVLIAIIVTASAALGWAARVGRWPPRR
jgi:hypothetical protein